MLHLFCFKLVCLLFLWSQVVYGQSANISDLNIEDVITTLGDDPILNTQDTLPMDIVLKQAYENHPTISTARQNINISHERYSQANSGFRPTLSLDNSISHNISGSSTQTGQHTSNKNTNRSLSLSLRYNVFNGGSDQANINARQQDILISNESYHAAVNDILLQTISSYLQVSRNQMIARLRQYENDYLKATLKAAQNRFELGDITRTDVVQIEARLASSDALVVNANNQIDIAKSQLYKLTEYDIGDNNLQFPKFSIILPNTIDEAIDIAFKENSSMKISHMRIDVSKFEKQSAYGDLLPNIDMTMQQSYQFNTTTGPRDSQNTTLTANINVPLYQSGKQWSEYRQAQHNQILSELQFADEKRKIRQIIEMSFADINRLKATEKANQIAISTNQIALDGVTQEALFGVRTTVDVLNAAVALLDARITYINNRFDQLGKLYELASVLGLLTIDALDLDVSYYQSEQDFDKVDSQIWGDKDGIVDYKWFKFNINDY